jgi:cobalt-zinc-cadmium efflux system membrane fusion protein
MKYSPLFSRLMLACLVTLSACHDAPPRMAATPQPIVQNNQLRFPSEHPQLALLGTATAAQAKNLTIDLPARLIWNEERTQRIYPAFSGRVTTIHADVGRPVHTGNVLAELASPEFGAAQADAARALADLQWMQKNLGRQTELFEAGIVARKDLEQAQADAARAKAEAERAQARVRLYGGGADVNQQLALRAGIPGVVVERNLNPSQEVRPDQSGPGMPALFVITDPSVLWAQIDAREVDLPSVQPGTRVSLSIPSLPGQQFEATITAVADFIDPMTRTIKLRASVNNAHRLLKSEMLATARFERKLSAGVMVPATAVFLRGTQHYVFVKLPGGIFEPREVKVWHEGPKEVVIGEGLKEGEEVVSENGLLLARELRNAQEEAHQKPLAIPQVKP